MTEAQALELLRERCAAMGMPVTVALAEKADEIACRAFLLCIPNSTLRPEQVPAYLRLIGHEPTPDLVDQVLLVRRGPRLEADEVIQLEQRQNLRCTLCGTHLTRGAR